MKLLLLTLISIFSISVFADVPSNRTSTTPNTMQAQPYNRTNPGVPNNTPPSSIPVDTTPTPGDIPSAPNPENPTEPNMPNLR